MKDCAVEYVSLDRPIAGRLVKERKSDWKIRAMVLLGFNLLLELTEGGEELSRTRIHFLEVGASDKGIVISRKT